MAASLLLALVGELHRYDGSRPATLELSLAVFAIAYVGGLIGFLVQLRLFGGGDGHLGMFALVSLIAIVKMSDIGQYTAGRLFGRHKLAPTISPGKTWEGVLGGVVFAFVAAWVMARYAAPTMLGAKSAARRFARLACRLFYRSDSDGHRRRSRGVALQARRRREGFQQLAARVWGRARPAGFAAGGGTDRVRVLGIRVAGGVKGAVWGELVRANGRRGKYAIARIRQRSANRRNSLL